MWRIAIKNLRSNLSRFVATLVAIATGVGFLTAGSMLTTSIKNSLGGTIDTQYSAVASAIQPVNASEMQGAPGVTIGAGIIKTVADVPGVRSAAGEVNGSASIIKSGKRIKTSTFASGYTVRSWITDAELNPLDIESGRGPKSSHEITIDRGIAEKQRLAVGDSVQVTTATGTAKVTVVGITAFGTSDSPDPTGTLSAIEPFVFDLAGSGIPAYTSVLVTADPGVSPRVLTQRLSKVAPAGTTAITGDDFRTEAKGASDTFASFLEWPLRAFSGLALFVCAFVIFNTFNVVVSQRIRELALMRAIAATPRQIRRSLRAEGLGIGLLGSILGIGLGVALMYLLAAALSAFDVNLPSAQIVLTPWMVVWGLLFGTLITLLATLVPAMRAGRTAPVEAMRDAAVESKKSTKARMISAIVATALGFGLMFLDNSWAIAAGALLFIVGVLLAGPSLATGFSRLGMLVLTPLGVAPRLSADNIARNPKRTSTTINALVIGLFLVTLVTIAGQSFKRTAVQQLNDLSSADIIIGAKSGSIPSKILDTIKSEPGVTALARLRSFPVLQPDDPTSPDGDRHPGSLSAGDPDALEALGITTTEGSLADLGDGVAVMSLGLPVRIGDKQTFFDAAGKKIELPVTAIVDFSVDALSVGGAGAFVSTETLRKLAPDAGETAALVKIDKEHLAKVESKIEKLTAGYGNVEVAAGNIVGRVIGSVFDFMINAVYGLLGMSILISLIGIVNTLTLSIFERRRELGLLRAVGMTPREVRHMIGFESVQVAILGTLVGMGSGTIMGWLVIRASEFSEITLDWQRLGMIFAFGVAIGLLASIVPVWRVSRLEMLEALAST